MVCTPPGPLLTVLRTSSKVGPHFVVFRMTCSRTAILLTDFGNTSSSFAPSQGRYSRGVMMPTLAYALFDPAASSTALENTPASGPKMKRQFSAWDGPDHSNTSYFRPTALSSRSQMPVTYL